MFKKRENLHSKTIGFKPEGGDGAITAVQKTIRMFMLLTLIAAALVLAACGYRFVQSGNLPEDTQTVFVSIFNNRTLETGIEHIFTNDLIFEFTRHGQAVVRPERADAILEGVVESMRIETVSYRGRLTALERRIIATLSLRLRDRDGDLIWSLPAISEEETYGIMEEKVATDYNKRQAIQALSKRLAEDIYSRMTDEF
ncbi:MAG: LptE family protein [Thermodesulfobacteriota bacterium]